MSIAPVSQQSPCFKLLTDHDGPNVRPLGVTHSGLNRHSAPHTMHLWVAWMEYRGSSVWSIIVVSRHLCKKRGVDQRRNYVTPVFWGYIFDFGQIFV